MQVGHISKPLVYVGAALLIVACSSIPPERGTTNERQAGQVQGATPTQPAPTAQPTPTLSQNVPQGYLLAGSDSVQFLRWTEDQYGQASGQFQRVHTAQQGPLAVEASNGSITFTRNTESNDVQVQFNSGNAYIGTLTDDVLTLVVPSTSGELQTLEYRRASVEEYNEAARSFRQRIEQQAAEAQAYADEQARLDRLEREWQAAADSAERYLTSLTQLQPAAWFTQQDPGVLAGLVRDAQAQLSYAKEAQQQGYCDGIQAYDQGVGVSQQSFEEYRRNFNADTESFKEAVRVMREKREALGDAASPSMIDTTNTIEAQARPKIDVVNQKYDKADQLLKGIAQDIAALSCTPTEVVNEWQAAADRADQYIESLAPLDPDEWFTEQDTGLSAELVRDARSQLSYAKDVQQQGDCSPLPAYADQVRALEQQLDAYRSDFDTNTQGFNEAVGIMKEKRKMLGNTAPSSIVETTNTIEERAQPKIELVNRKYNKAQQVLQDTAQEIDDLQCKQNQE